MKRLIWMIPCGVLLSVLFSYALFFKAYYLPSGSMNPSLIEGDVVVVWDLPFLKTPTKFTYGDVVILQHPERDFVIIKRVVALPGDKVVMQGGRLLLNGKFTTSEERRPLSVEVSKVWMERGIDQQRETLPNGKSYWVLDVGDGYLDDMPEYTIQKGSYFVVGDNRDNSADSRMFGAVTEQDLKHKVKLIIYSRDGWKPRWHRFLKRVN